MKREHGVMQTPRREGKSFRSKDSRASVSIHLPIFFLLFMNSLWLLSVPQPFRYAPQPLRWADTAWKAVLPYYSLFCLSLWWNIWWILALVTTGTNDITNSQYLIPSPSPFWSTTFLFLSLSLPPFLILCASLFMLRVYIRFLGCYSHNHGQEITSLPPKVQDEGPFTCSTVRVTDTIAKFQGKTIFLFMFWVFSFSPQVIEGNKMGRLFTKNLTSGFSFDTVLMCHMGMAPVSHWGAFIYPAHMLWVLVWAAKCQLDDMHLKSLQTRVVLFPARDLCLKKVWTGEQSLNPLSVLEWVLLFHN